MYRNTESAGACSFTLDNVLLTQTAYTHSTTCSTGVFDAYAWGHNGQLKDNELYGNNITYTAEYWEYDSRLLRRWNTDPIEYEWQSAYACFNNNPVYYADPLGLEGEGGDGGGNKDGKGIEPSPNDPFMKEKTRTPVGDVLTGEPHIEQLKSVTITPSPAEPQDGGESGTGSGGGWTGKAADFAFNGSTVYQIANGNYGEAAWAAFPAAKIAYDYWTTPYYIADNLVREDYIQAGTIYGGQILTGASLMLGARIPKGNGKAMTDAAKKSFSQGVTETGEVLAGSVDDAAKTGLTFFQGAKYSDKVLRQMNKADDLFHGFPKSVDGFATKYGQWSTKIGGDGKAYQWLKMEGSYGGKTGVFEYTKDANGIINHRFFNVTK